MDYAIIDTEYQKLQSEANSVGDKIQNLAAKLQKLQSSGNQDAREWLLDLKDIALSVQSEQNQMFLFCRLYIKIFHRLATSVLPSRFKIKVTLISSNSISSSNNSSRNKKRIFQFASRQRLWAGYRNGRRIWNRR
jgi:hypothetical protein